MILHNRLSKNIALVIVLAAGITGCQKLVHPLLGTYPKDANPPGGPLKFYAAMDSTDVDSIRANYGTDNDVTFADGGVSGKAAQFNGSKNGYINYASANDFGSATSFTVSFWINITLAQKNNVNAVGVLSFAHGTNFWGNICFYADHTTGGASDSMDLKCHFANGAGDNWDFAGYTGAARWPHMYDGNWHQVAFTYDASTGTGIMYRDGVQFDKKTGETIVFGSPSQLIVGGFQEAAGIVSTYSANTWMSGFPGKIDNVRLYGVALAATDVNALFTNKQ